MPTPDHHTNTNLAGAYQNGCHLFTCVLFRFFAAILNESFRRGNWNLIPQFVPVAFSLDRAGLSANGKSFKAADESIAYGTHSGAHSSGTPFSLCMCKCCRPRNTGNSFGIANTVLPILVRAMNVCMCAVLHSLGFGLDGTPWIMAK